jgi:hypothetical protein
MILQNIIPTNILAALRTYIRNYVDSLQNAFLNYYDYQSGSVTSFTGPNTWTELMVTSVISFAQGGLTVTNGVVTNNGTTANYQLSASITINGEASNQIEFCFAKNESEVESTYQSVILFGSTKYDSVTIQGYSTLGANEDLRVYVRNVTDAGSVTLGSINVNIRQV